jgi:Transposase IS66 family
MDRTKWFPLSAELRWWYARVCDAGGPRVRCREPGFHDIQVATRSPIAEEALRRIAALYAIEADIRGRSAGEHSRQEHSMPLVDTMHAWFTELLARFSGRSALAQSVRWAMNHWDGMICS